VADPEKAATAQIRQSALKEEGSLKIGSETSRRLERGFLVAGVILLAVYGSALLHQSISSRFALWQFNKDQTAAKGKDLSTPPGPKDEGGVDFSLWAAKRIQAYRDSLVSKTDAPLAVLQIAKLRIEVPVFEGTDDLTLNRGVGRIIGSSTIGSATSASARPGTPGNIGIAGHRDGFFRGLKDITVGDDVELITTKETATYIVDQIEIVSPSDVRVLQVRSAPSITLVTCYPFYFVGDAPNRFIVHASLASEQSSNKIQPTSKVFNHN
jgi:sortase A